MELQDFYNIKLWRKRMGKYKIITQDDLQESSKIKIISQLTILDLVPEIDDKEYDLLCVSIGWNMAKILKNNITHHKGVHSTATIQNILDIMK
jgi:hypothetical protein